MSVSKCPNCGQKISDVTQACPSCGYQISQDSLDSKASASKKPGNHKLKKTICICVSAVTCVAIICFTLAFNAPMIYDVLKPSANSDETTANTNSYDDYQYYMNDNSSDNLSEQDAYQPITENNFGAIDYTPYAVNSNNSSNNESSKNSYSSNSTPSTTRKTSTTKPSTTKQNTTKPITTKPNSVSQNTTQPSTNPPTSNKNLTLQDFKDYCVNHGVYSGGEYGISTTYTGSNYVVTTNMVYNPTDDQLRFEQVDKAKDYRYLSLYIEPNTTSYKWQFQWINGSYFMVGEGNAIKNKKISITSSDEEKYNFMQPYTIYETAGQVMTNDIKKSFVSAAFTDLHAIIVTMDSYFEKNHSNLSMDFFELYV